MSKKLILIDGHSILNRAFFGIPDLTNQRGFILMRCMVSLILCLNL